MFEVTIHTLPHLKCIRLVSVRSTLPCINTGVRIELTFNFILYRVSRTLTLPIRTTKFFEAAIYCGWF